MNNLIHLIADYGVGDPAFAEVIQKLKLLISESTIIPTSIPAFSTLATGFWTCQYATVNPIPGMFIYTNTAPRKDNKNIRENNEGEKLMYAKLQNGVTVIGVNAGFCFSFIKKFIQEYHEINVANKGSQFRSRDFYPDAVAGIILNNGNYIGLKADISTLPEFPSAKIAWIDGYGNIKTTSRKSEINFKPGQPVLIELNGMKRTAFFTDGTFSVREGELAYAPGSTGATDPFMEIFLRGLSAWREFGKPLLEESFSVLPI
jgi:S-adenosylmethionine hydrolase